jgi:hypothetical protein
MRLSSWGALSIAAGMSSCSLAVATAPVAQLTGPHLMPTSAHRDGPTKSMAPLVLNRTTITPRALAG